MLSKLLQKFLQWKKLQLHFLLRQHGIQTNSWLYGVTVLRGLSSARPEVSWNWSCDASGPFSVNWSCEASDQANTEVSHIGRFVQFR